MSTELTFNECMDMIEADGRDMTYMLQGEPGIGKTTIGKELAQKLNYPFAYIDMANMSLGDTMLPVANKDERCAEYYPNEIFKLHLGQPVVVLLDEWTKAGREAKNMTLPLALERRLGSIQLHRDSIVLATGNMASDGVGDSIQGHQISRFVPVRLKKPSADEWVSNYAIPHGLDATVCAFVQQFPQVMQSYTDDPNGDNKYIFQPKQQKGPYVCPRSLEFASHQVKTRDKKSAAALHAGLAGSIGEAGAADLLSFVNLSEQLVPFASIVADPTGAAVPDKPTTRLLQTFNILMRIDKSSLTNVLTYMDRYERELQGIFINKVLTTPSLSSWASQSKAMVDRCVKMNSIF